MPPPEIPSDALVLLLGPAGCGKTTFARRHFAPTQIVSSDACRRLVADDEADQGASPQAFTVFRTIIRARLSLRRLTVADATNLKATSRLELREIAAEFGVPVVVLVLDVPIERCLAQNEARDRRVRPEVVEWQYRMFERAREAVPNEGYAAVHTVGPGAVGG